jgi:hypothetical protein
MDPELMQMQADTYGWVVKWPNPEPPRKPDPVGTNAEAFGALWCCFAVVLFVVRWIKKSSVFVVLFCLIILNLRAAYTSVHIGDSSEYLILHDANNIYKLHYEVQVDAGIFRIQVLATDPAHFGVLVDTGVVYDYIDDYRAGFSWSCVRATGGNLTGGGIDGNLFGPNGNLYSLRHSAGTASYGGYSYTVGDVLTLKIWKRVHYTTDLGWQYSEVVIGDIVLGTGTIYFVTFTLPENTSTARRDYFASQNGKVIDNTYQSAGSGARAWRIGPLVSDASVSLSVITGGRIAWDAANGLAIVTDETISAIVNPGVTPLVGTLTTGGGTGPVSDVPDSIPSVPSDPQPALPNPTTGGGGLLLVPGTSEATTAATTGDISEVTAGIATGANAVVTNATSNANGIIGAVNRSVTALDKINATLQSSSKGGFDDGNIVAGLSDVKLAVDSVTAAIEAQNTTDGVPDSGVVPATTEGLTSTVNFSSDHAGALIGALPVAPTFSGITPSSTVHIAFHIPSPGHSDIEVDKTIDFSAEPYATPILVFRTCLLVVVTVGFYFGAFWAVRGAVAGK